jgi:CheY-like chemotaxis protein
MTQTEFKILLVDDEPSITDNLKAFPERAGDRVDCAADGRQALGKIESVPPDLVILDVLMPEMDGRAVLRDLRKRGNHTPVILLTQVGEAGEHAMALEEGADDYLNKPFDPRELPALRPGGVAPRAGFAGAALLGLEADVRRIGAGPTCAAGGARRAPRKATA